LSSHTGPAFDLANFDLADHPHSSPDHFNVTQCAGDQMTDRFLGRFRAVEARLSNDLSVLWILADGQVWTLSSETPIRVRHGDQPQPKQGDQDGS